MYIYPHIYVSSTTSNVPQREVVASDDDEASEVPDSTEVSVLVSASGEDESDMSDIEEPPLESTPV